MTAYDAVQKSTRNKLQTKARQTYMGKPMGFPEHSNTEASNTWLGFHGTIRGLHRLNHTCTAFGHAKAACSPELQPWLCQTLAAARCWVWTLA